MPYTQSKDGVERVTVLVPMRFTREEMAWLTRHSCKKTSVREMLSGWLDTWLWEKRAEEDERRDRGFSDDF